MLRGAVSCCAALTGHPSVLVVRHDLPLQPAQTDRLKRFVCMGFKKKLGVWGCGGWWWWWMGCRFQLVHSILGSLVFNTSLRHSTESICIHRPPSTLTPPSPYPVNPPSFPDLSQYDIMPCEPVWLSSGANGKAAGSEAPYSFTINVDQSMVIRQPDLKLPNTFTINVDQSMVKQPDLKLTTSQLTMISQW